MTKVSNGVIYKDLSYHSNENVMPLKMQGPSQILTGNITAIKTALSNFQNWVVCILGGGGGGRGETWL